ncbi:MAG: hypothetical protein WKG07_43315 [Hymenobacter sp.]
MLMAIPDVALNKGILPGKIFEYLAAHKPVLCVGPAGSDADKILREAGAGRTLPYADYKLMRRTLDELAARWQLSPDLDLPPTPWCARYARQAQAARLAELVRAGRAARRGRGANAAGRIFAVSTEYSWPSTSTASPCSSPAAPARSASSLYAPFSSSTAGAAADCILAR